MRGKRSLGIVLVAGLVMGSTEVADAQLPRRSRSAEGTAGVPPVERGDQLRLPRRPFVGGWEGWSQLASGQGAEQRMPLRILVDSAQSGSGYASSTVHPGGKRSANPQTVERDGMLYWRSPNSGGGWWEYSARLVTPDSIAGTVRLRDWPQLAAGQTAPSGTFVLVRRAAAPSRGR